MPLQVRYGRWWYRFWLKRREYMGSTGLAATRSNESAARRFLESKRKEAEQKLERQAPTRMLFDAAAQEFLDWATDVEHRQKPHTAARLRTSFASLREYFGRRVVSEITTADVDGFTAWRIQTHGVREVTARHDLHALSSFFRKWAVRRGLAQSNPVRDASKPSDREAIRIHVISREEEEAYFAAAAGRNSALFDVARLILLQGCRPEEIMTLRPGDVDLARNRILIPGGKSRAARRTLELTEEAAAILRRRLVGAQWWLFQSSRYGRNHHITKLNNTHDRICREAGVSFVLYDLRHTFATRMVEAGCDLPTLAAILGHASLRMVMRYVHPTQAHQAAAIARYEQKFGRRPAIVPDQRRAQ